MSGDRDESVERLLAEGLKTVSQALSEVGIHVSAWTAMRWCRRGAAGRRLESVKIGGKWLTSLPAVKRFVASRARDRGSSRTRSGKTKIASERFLESIGLGREDGDGDRTADS